MILVGYIDNIGSKSFVGQENCEKIIKERVCGLLIFIFMLENGLKGRPPLPIQSPGPQQWGSVLDRWVLFVFEYLFCVD